MLPVPIPSGHHSALPGAVLTAVGLFLIVWALEGFGLIGGGRDTGITTFPNGEGNRPVPKGGSTPGVIPSPQTLAGKGAA